tara:strand:- start:526 stop:1074 length:549 start_codon:yes stop_codon:yes gene_type:complete
MKLNSDAPGFFFVWILLFSLLGLFITAVVLAWVYSGFSPRNTASIEYLGNIEFRQPIEGQIKTKKEIHNYRFQGKKGDIIDLNLTTDTDIRFGTTVIINNPKQLFTIIKDPLESANNGDVSFVSKRVKLNKDGTYTVSIEYDFNRHSNYYDFDFFFQFWDRDKQSWISDYPKYIIEIDKDIS